MAQRVACRAPLAAGSRLGEASRITVRPAACFTRTAALRSTAPQLSHRQRRSAVQVAAVLDVTEGTFEAEVLQVRTF